MVLSYYRTRTAKNSRVLDILVSQGERACRLFFYPCLKQIEPQLYNNMRSYVSNVNERIENDINAVNSEDETLLHIAAAHGHTEIIDYLIGRGAKLEVKDKKGRTPLHRAAERGHGEAVKMLLQLGANMYTLDQEGKKLLTPLHVASYKGHVEVAQKLLRRKANVNVKDKQAKTALHLAAEAGNPHKLFLTAV
uniref:Uncharacterized protein n=1 Tax=Podarcis muralis TaxID=64176 RepID=A0A670I346_PODMU